MELLLSEWARWRGCIGESASGDAAATQSPREPGPPMLVGSQDFVQVDEAISRLPHELVATVSEVYQTGTTMVDHVRRLGCPEATIARRIGRAHRLLIDILATRVGNDAREHERSSMSARLAESHSSGR